MRVSFRAAALTAALLLSLVLPAQADDATLTARGGGLSVSGRLVTYDGTHYRIDTTWGRLTVDAAAVECVGPGCPDLMQFVPEWRVAAEPWLADRVLRPLAAGFAAAEGLDLTVPDRDTLDLAHKGRVVLRLRLLALSGSPDPVLAAGGADSALGVPGPGQAPGPLVARLPLVLASAPDAPPGPLPRDALRAARGDPDPTWAALGQAGRPLVWHSLPPGTTLDRATTAALGPARGALRRATDPAALADALRTDPWGLSLLPSPPPEGVKARAMVTPCGLTADLSDFAAAAGAHPLTLALHWIPGKGRTPPLARDFAAWTAGPAAQRLLAASGVPAPAAALRRPMAAQGQRLANALAAARTGPALEALRAGLARLDGAEQLATSFRFDPRSGALDAAAQSALADLSDHLASGALTGYEILLVGLTDAEQPAAEGLARAKAVLTALRDATPDLPATTTLAALGLGAILPLDCDDTAEGRHLNRRVEVWARPNH